MSDTAQQPPQQGLLTCMCCRLSFLNSEEQRNHYKTDFHRFNLKRQVTNLPPISEKIFNEKVSELKSKEEKEATFSAYCKFCKKAFSNQKTHETHLKSKKHIEREAKGLPLNSSTSSNKSDAESVQPCEMIIETPKDNEEQANVSPKKLTDEEIAEIKIKNAKHLAIGDCLFCSNKAQTLEANIEHMTFAHGLFIPDLEYISDLEGFIKYLGEKVGTGNVCLYCNKMFRTCEAVQNHMASTAHWKINYDDDTDEYDDFYDFSKSWEKEGLNPDEEDDDPEKYKQIMLATGKGVVGLADDGYSLVLANGSVLGHRDLKIFYKQKFKPKDTRDSVLLHNVLNRYRAIGWHTAFSKEDMKLKAKIERQRHYHALDVSVKANKLQTFFRHEVIF